MQLVDEEDDFAFALLDFLDHRLETVFELAAVLRAGNHRAEVECDHALVLQSFGNIARDDSLSEAFHDRRFANAGLSNEHGIIFRSTGKDLHHATDFLVAPDDGVELAAASVFGQVASVAL